MTNPLIRVLFLLSLDFLRCCLIKFSLSENHLLDSLIGRLSRIEFLNGFSDAIGFFRIDFRKISTARTLIDNGRNASELQKLYGLPDYPARKLMDAARRFTPDFCRMAALLVVETDYKMKTSADDNERLLEMLILQLAQEARNG